MDCRCGNKARGYCASRSYLPSLLSLTVALSSPVAGPQHNFHCDAWAFCWKPGDHPTPAYHRQYLNALLSSLRSSPPAGVHPPSIGACRQVLEDRPTYPSTVDACTLLLEGEVRLVGPMDMKTSGSHPYILLAGQGTCPTNLLLPPSTPALSD